LFALATPALVTPWPQGFVRYGDVLAMKVGPSFAAPSERNTMIFCVPARPSLTSSW